MRGQVLVWLLFPAVASGRETPMRDRIDLCQVLVRTDHRPENYERMRPKRETGKMSLFRLLHYI